MTDMPIIPVHPLAVEVMRRTPSYTCPTCKAEATSAEWCPGHPEGDTK